MNTKQGITPIIIAGIVAVLALAAGGYFYAQKQLQVSQPDWLPATGGQEENDETAGWQTYRNEEYGFEVKYPKKWSMSALDINCPPTSLIVSTKHNLIGFIKGKETRDCLGPTLPGIFVIEVGNVYPNKIVWGKNVVKEAQEEITIDGIPATLFKGTRSAGGELSIVEFTAIVLEKDGRYFLINNYESSEEVVFDIFLSTFKFID